jgi:myo-inositol-1(or 4)-monophosphatase
VSAPDVESLREVAVALAREAGAVLREGYGVTHQPEHKGRFDLVTAYDRRAERLILDGLTRRFPGHAVLAEESGAHASAGAPVRWIVDPLDGTTNFAHNYPCFCVSIAAEVDGEVVAGAVFDPVRDELFAAARGLGATLNGVRLRVSDIARLEDALLVTGFPYDVREHPENVLPAFEAFLMRAQGVRRDGSAALNLCYVGAGRFDGLWEAGLSPWDIAAGALVVREAGGRISDYAGASHLMDGRPILASNGHVHAEMLEILAAAVAR